MSMYVIGDIHGCYSEFMQLVDKIEAQDDDAKFILVGDIIDRGPEQLKMLDWAMDNVNKPDSKFQMIMGNHEYEKIDLLYEYIDEYEENGRAYWQHDLYRFNELMEEANYPIEKIKDIYEFITSLPLYIQYECKLGSHKQNYIIVHGDIPSDCINKDETVRKWMFTAKRRYRYSLRGTSLTFDIVWPRNSFGHPKLKKTIVVHGHTPTIMAGPFMYQGYILYNAHDINVDCGIAYRAHDKNANLAAIRLEDLKEFYLYGDGERMALLDGARDYKEEMIHRPRKRHKKDEEFDLNEIDISLLRFKNAQMREQLEMDNSVD